MSDEDLKSWIYAGGLPYELTEGDLICVFSQYGEVHEISLARDKDTGKSRGFCFIKYEDSRSCELSVDNLNGASIVGRKIKVSRPSNLNFVKNRKPAVVAPNEASPTSKYEPFNKDIGKETRRNEIEAETRHNRGQDVLDEGPTHTGEDSKSDRRYYKREDRGDDKRYSRKEERREERREERKEERKEERRDHKNDHRRHGNKEHDSEHRTKTRRKDDVKRDFYDRDSKRDHRDDMDEKNRSSSRRYHEREDRDDSERRKRKEYYGEERRTKSSRNR